MYIFLSYVKDAMYMYVKKVLILVFIALVEISNIDNYVCSRFFLSSILIWDKSFFFMSMNLYLSYFAQSWTVMSVL